MKIKRCGKCGSKEVKLQSQKGKAFPYKDYASVFLRADFPVLECTLCHELILSSESVSELNELVKKSISQDVRFFIDTILKREGCSQTDLSAHVGVTEEYLSEIKSGRKQPAFQTYNILKLLASLEHAYEVASPGYKANTGKISA